MRGVLVKEWTEFDNLTLEDCPMPEPGPGEVRLRLQAGGVSFAASLVVAGKYQRKPPLPFVPGTEGAGIVDAVGAGSPGSSRATGSPRSSARAPWANTRWSGRATASSCPTASSSTAPSASPRPT